MTSQQLVNILKAEGVRPHKVEQIMEKVGNIQKYNDESTMNKDDFILLIEYPICKPTLVALEIKKITTVGDLKRYVILNGAYALKDNIRAIGDSRYDELKRIFPWLADYEL